MKKIKKAGYIPWEGTPNDIFNKDIGNWEYQLKKDLNKEDIDIDLVKNLKIDDCDACLIFDNIFYKNLDIIWKLYKAKLLHKSTYIDYEPPSGHCRNHDKKGIKKLSRIFKNVITYNDDLRDNKKIFKGNIGNFYSQEIFKVLDVKSKKLLVMITNNTSIEEIRNTLNYYNKTEYYNNRTLKEHPNAIYNKREEIAEYFLKKCPKEFDLYGALWSDKFKPVLKGYLNKTDKIETLSKYKFAISYDSIINQNGYISEKIFDCFKAKTVPVYLGASNVTNYIPKACFIDKRDFDNYDDLYDYLTNMEDNEYNKYIISIEKYLKSNSYKENFSSKASANIIKETLLNNTNDFSYKKAYKSIMYFQKKRNKVLKKMKIDCYISNLEENGNKIEISFVTYINPYEDDHEYYIKINNLYQKITNYIDLDEYGKKLFKIDINWNCKPINISVFFKKKGKRTKLIINDLESKEKEEYGLKRINTKQLRYYNYRNMNFKGKNIYLFKYNKKEFIKKIKFKIKSILKR